MDIQILEPLKPLGSGAVGHVWLANDVRLGRKVAVKFFDELPSSQQALAARKHAEALSRVEHPSLVRVYALEEQAHPQTGIRQLAMIMEYCQGETLNRCHVLDRRQAEEIARDLADAVEAIHRAGLCHGDLHERNVLVARAGAKVFDLLAPRAFDSVGERVRSEQDDLLDLADLIAQALGGVTGIDRKAVEAARKSSESAPTVAEVRDAFSEFVPFFQKTPPARRTLASSFRPSSPTAADAIVRATAAPFARGAWAPDERSLALWASSGTGSGILWIWDTEQRRIRGGCDFGLEAGRSFDLVAWTPGGTRVAASAYDRYAILSGDGEAIFSGDAFVLYDQLAISPDGELFAWITAYGSVALARSDGSSIHFAQVHPGFASYRSHLSWSPDGRRLAVAEPQIGAQLWDREGNFIGRIWVEPGELGQPPAVAWNEAGDRLAIATEAGALLYLDAESGLPAHLHDGIHRLSDGDGVPGDRGICFVGRHLCVSGPRSLRLWDPETGRELNSTTVPDDLRSSLLRAPRGDVCALVIADGYFWCSAKGAAPEFHPLPAGDARAVGWDADYGLWCGTRKGIFRATGAGVERGYLFDQPVSEVAVGPRSLGLARQGDYVLWRPGDDQALSLRPAVVGGHFCPTAVVVPTGSVLRPASM